ncbi:hypothetical protein [Streptomyces sp. NPDC059224]
MTADSRTGSPSAAPHHDQASAVRLPVLAGAFDWRVPHTGDRVVAMTTR